VRIVEVARLRCYFICPRARELGPYAVPLTWLLYNAIAVIMRMCSYHQTIWEACAWQVVSIASLIPCHSLKRVIINLTLPMCLVPSETQAHSGIRVTTSMRFYLLFKARDRRGSILDYIIMSDRILVFHRCHRWLLDHTLCRIHVKCSLLH